MPGCFLQPAHLTSLTPVAPPRRAAPERYSGAAGMQGMVRCRWKAVPVRHPVPCSPEMEVLSSPPYLRCAR